MSWKFTFVMLILLWDFLGNNIKCENCNLHFGVFMGSRSFLLNYPTFSSEDLLFLVRIYFTNHSKQLLCVERNRKSADKNVIQTQNLTLHALCFNFYFLITELKPTLFSLVFHLLFSLWSSPYNLIVFPIQWNLFQKLHIKLYNLSNNCLLFSLSFLGAADMPLMCWTSLLHCGYGPFQCQ